jgi:hypothetical protein
VDNSGSFTALASSTTWINTILDPVAISQGVTLGTMVGESIHRRAVTVNMQAYNSSTATYGEGQIRLVIWKPKLRYGASYGRDHVTSRDDFNSFFDFDKISIIKDFRLTIGNNSNTSAVSLIKSWKMVLYDNKKIKLANVSGTLYNIPDPDRYYIAAFCNFNDIVVRWNARMTFTDC